MQIRSVCAVLILKEGGGHGNIENIGGMKFCRKVEMSTGNGLIESILKAGFNDMDFPGAEGADNLFGDIETANLETGAGQCDCGGQADVAKAHNGNFFHKLQLPF